MSKYTKVLTKDYPKTHTLEHNLNVSKALKGYVKTETHKQKIAATLTNLFINPENHPNWKGGIRYRYPKEFNRILKLKIRTRDNFICCLCGKTEYEEKEELNRVLCVNHIDFNKENCKENNLNTLCLRCNVKVNRNREYWTHLFQSMLT